MGDPVAALLIATSTRRTMSNLADFTAFAAASLDI